MRLWRDLGPWGATGFHLWSAAVLLSAFVHPWLYVGMAWQVASASAAPLAVGWVGEAGPGVLGWLAIVNLAAGYAAAIALGASAAARRKLQLGAAVWTLPLYWLAISVAAHRALIELIRSPFHWEKTEHHGQR